MASNPAHTQLVDKIIAKANEFKKMYKSPSLSSAHLILAIIEINIKKEFDPTEMPELKEAINAFSLNDTELAKLYTEIDGFLDKTPLFSISEGMTYSDVFVAAEKCIEQEGRKEVIALDIVKCSMGNYFSAVAKIYYELFGKYLFGTFNTKEPIINRNLKIELDDIFDEELDSDFDELFGDEAVETDNLNTTVAAAKEVQTELFSKVFGQDEAVSSLVSGYFDAVVKAKGERNDSRPLATFLFAGAPGVGKTYLAECTAKALNRPFKRFDMSGFHEKESGLTFAGSNKVYKNGHAGIVTDFVRKNPNCVVLFDEIEKAHINVIHLFLQILDAGHLRDAFTEENVSFSNAIVIMTTNAGRSLYENENENNGAISRKVIINALANEKDAYTNAPIFPTAICSRFASGNVVLFNPLGALDLVHIAEGRMDEYFKTFKAGQEIDITRDKYIGAALLFAEGGKADARSLKGRADSFVSSEIYNWMKFAYEKDSQGFEKLKRIDIKVDTADLPSETMNLFEKEDRVNILLFSERLQAFEKIANNTKFNVFVAGNEEKARQILSDNYIDFVLCDIISSEFNSTLNIEDISSSGRKMFETFKKELIPFFVLCQHSNQMNTEERQALLEQGAHGIFECYEDSDIEANLDEVARLVHCEEMLGRLARANRVLTFECNYRWSEDKTVGEIAIAGLRVAPAIDAEDRDSIIPEDVSSVTFEQIIGAEDAKAELESFISYLKNPRQYAKFNVPAPKGLILYGPPGTGKTMLAKALARESGASFIATQGNEFLKSGLGKGAEAMHEVFRKARKYAPCVLFIDEIDVIAKDRMISDYAADVANALLNEMDGFSTNPTKPVFVLAATNFDVQYGQKSALDAALLRRFDRRIFVDLPDREDRRVYITERLNKSHQTLNDDVISNLAERSIGMSLAELASVIDFALRTMIMKNQSVLTVAMLDEAFETYRFGEKTEWREEVLRRVAIHEAGHAFVAWCNGEKPNYITVTGRSNFGGYTQFEQNESPILTSEDLENKIRVCLAGRAAEIVFYGKKGGASTGAADDLNKATKLAVKMVNELGMVSSHGLTVEHEEFIGNDTVEMCNKILDAQLDKATELIRKNKAIVNRLVEELIAKNHLMGKAIEDIFNV